LKSEDSGESKTGAGGGRTQLRSKSRDRLEDSGERKTGVGGGRAQLRSKSRERPNSSNVSLDKSISSLSNSSHSNEGEGRFRSSNPKLIVGSRLGSSSGSSGSANRTRDRKGGSEIFEKEKRRLGRDRLASQQAKRGSRKSGIFASLDSQEEEANIHAGPLMRKAPGRTNSDDGLRPFSIRATPRRSRSELGQLKNFAPSALSASKSNLTYSSSRLHHSVSAHGGGLKGADSFHPSSRTNLGMSQEDEPEEVPVWQKRKEESAHQKAEFEKSIGKLDFFHTSYS
jgi:hypothetical protein